jgi:sec-independent protein translocase protein TatC
MISYVLTRVGILTPEWMKMHRRHAVVVILVVAAVLTPSPDPINQLIFAAPLWVLFEISIIISKFAVRKTAVRGAN